MKPKDHSRTVLRRYGVLLLILAAVTGFMLHAEKAGAAGLFTILNGGRPLEAAGGIESAVSLTDPSANVRYLVYASGGVLHALVTADEGATLQASVPDLNGHQLSNVRQLTLLSRLLTQPVVFFLADENGQTGLYGLRLTQSGGIELLLGHRLDDSLQGNVGSFEVLPRSPTSVLVLYLKSGRLKESQVRLDDSSRSMTSLDVSLPGQQVATFKARQLFAADHDVFVIPFLVSGSGGVGELWIAETTDDQLSSVVMIAAEQMDGQQGVRLDIAGDDGLHVAWTNGRKVSAYLFSGSGWILQAASTFASDAPTLLPITDRSDYISSVAIFPNGQIAVADGTGTFRALDLGGALLRPPGGIASSKGRLFLLTSLVNAQGQKRVDTRYFDFSERSWYPLDFPVVQNATLLDAWFSDTRAGVLAAVLYRESDGLHVLILQVGSADLLYHVIADVPIPEAVPPDASLEGEVIGERLVVLRAAGSVVVFDALTRDRDIGPGGPTIVAVSAADADPAWYLLSDGTGTSLVTPGTP